MPNCVAFGCVNRFGDKSLMLHQIPGCGWNTVPRKKWLINIRREDKYFHICSEHFEDECYEGDLKRRRKICFNVLTFNESMKNVF